MKTSPTAFLTLLAAAVTMLMTATPSRAQDKGAAPESDEAFLNPDSAAPKEEIPKPEQDETDTESTGDEAAEEDSKERKRDHAMQGFVNVLAGIGWYLVAPYDKNNPKKMCERAEDPSTDEDEGEPVCSGRSVWHLDMLGGFAPLPGFEVFVMFRLGLESTPPNMNQPNTRQIGAGIKVYTPKDGLFKLGFGVAPLFDFSDHGDADIGYDFVIHVPIQALFDFVPWFGAYLQVSPNISFVSEFRLEFTGGIGIQGRFP